VVLDRVRLDAFRSDAIVGKGLNLKNQRVAMNDVSLPLVGL
jgi:hypothetical protein